MRYQFTEDLITGNRLIDDEHKKLIKTADDIMVNITKGQGKESLDKAVKFLSDYTKTHFKHEEQLQEQCKFPDIQTHKAWHRNFEKELQLVAEKITKQGTSSVIVIELTRKFSALLNHIRTKDKALAEYIAKN